MRQGRRLTAAWDRTEVSSGRQPVRRVNAAGSRSHGRDAFPPTSRFPPSPPPHSHHEHHQPVVAVAFLPCRTPGDTVLEFSSGFFRSPNCGLCVRKTVGRRGPYIVGPNKKEPRPVLCLPRRSTTRSSLETSAVTWNTNDARVMRRASRIGTAV